MPALFGLLRKEVPGVNPLLNMNRSVACALVIALAGTATTFARAEEAPAAAPAPAVASAPLLDEGYLSDLVTHHVLQLLRAIDSPKLDHYKAAALGLRIARRWRPADAELLRGEIEAWDAYQDKERALAGTRELIKMDPLDTVALLRVITSRITALQDADQRLKSYEGLIGSKSIDASIRSRLALDAALLARETGDERGFLDRLLLASTLDVTHKEAAALTVTTYLDKSKDPKERFDLLTTLLLADPHDAEAHRNIAYELRRQMAFKASARFLDFARGLNSVEGREPTAPQQLEYFQSVWDSVGADKCLAELQKMLDMQVISEDMRRTRMEKSGRDPGPETEIRLPPAIERVRLMVHVSRMDDSGAAVSYRSLKNTHDESLTRLATDPPKAKEGEELPAHMRGDNIRRTLLLDHLWIRLFTGIEVADAEKDLLELCEPGPEGGEPLSPEAQSRFHGWLMILKGEVAEGRKLVEPLAEKDPTALWILGVAAQREGDVDKAAVYYEKLAREQAASAIGSTARQRWERVKGVPMPQTAVAAMLEAEGASFAPWMLRMIDDPRSYISLNVNATKPALGPFDRAEAVISLGNAGRQPLGLGVGRSINPRMMLAAQVVIGGTDVSASIRPEVINLSRRLRLMPGETVSATVWGGRGDLTTELDARPTVHADLRWTVTQGFVFSEGGFSAGPNSVRSQGTLVSRALIGNTVQGADAPDRMRGDARQKNFDQIKAEVLAEAVLNESEPTSFRALALACFRVGPERRDAAVEPVTETDSRTLQAALIERLTRSSTPETALILQRLAVSKSLDENTRPALLEAVKRCNHPALWTAALILLTENADSPVIAAAQQAQSGDAEVMMFASIVKDGFNRSSIAAPVQLDEEVKIVPVGPDGLGGGQNAGEQRQ